MLPVEKTKVGRDFYISNVHYGRCIGDRFKTIKLKKKTLNTFRTRPNFTCENENNLNVLQAPKKNDLNFPVTDFCF